MAANVTDETPRVAVSVERTVNLGNYESAKVFMSISNLMPGSSEEAIEEALETSASAYVLLKARVRDQVAEIKAKSTAARNR